MMDWFTILLSVFGSLLLILATGLPVVLAFILVTFASLYILQGGNGAILQQNILAMESSLRTFTLLPVPLFILMGEILWQSSIATNALGAIDKWLGRVPGRLSLLTVMSGTVFSALSGSTMANTAILGKLLLPDMHKRGYDPVMSMGPIMSSGALAMLIPPSALAVVYATIAQISIGALLMALILPGLILAISYVVYIVVRCYLNPALAPRDENLVRVSRAQALKELLVYVAPLSLVVFSVVGVIFLGIATPTEAAALGALSSLVLAAAYRGLTWKGFVSAIEGTAQISGMVLIIIAAAIGFSQLLAFSGASKGLLDYVVALSANPTVVILLMMALILVLGCFMEQIAIMSITLPIFVPILKLLGIEPVWFAVMMLINLEIGLMTPPFGLLLFVMKGVAPPEVTMQTIYRAATPYLIINALVIGAILIWPKLALLLPSLIQ
jgi:tripartite ATP-independent transporter DctM subunit